MIQSINDLKSNIKDIGWNPFLVGGASGLGTYALTRLLGGNKWLAAALGLGVGTGAGWLQYNHNDKSKTDNWIAGHNVGERSGKEQHQGDIREIAYKLGIPVNHAKSSNTSTSRELLSDILSKLRLSEVATDNSNRLTKQEIALLKNYLNDQPATLKKVLDRDKTMSFLNQRGHKLFMPQDDSTVFDDPIETEAYYNLNYPKERYPEQ